MTTMGHAANARDLKQLGAAPAGKGLPLFAQARYEMGDFRFKGYVNDFMMSPRNPITLQSSQQMAGILSQQSNVGNSYKYPQPPKQPPTQSAELKSRKHESDREIASFKQEKLQEMIRAEQAKKEEFEQMKQYKPFGKPGAGAPIYHSQHQRQRFTEYDTHTSNVPPPTESEDEEDEEYRQHDLRPVHPTAAAPVPYYKTDQPGNSAVDRALGDTQKRIEKLKKEMQELEASNVNSIPYIDPINGHPQRAPAASNGPFAFFDPWGKGQGNPRRKDDGNVQGHPAIKETGIVPTAKEMARSWPNSQQSAKKDGGVPKRGSAPVVIQAYPNAPPPWWESEPAKTVIDQSAGTGLNVVSKFGGSGEPVKTYSGSNRTRFPITMRKDIYGNSSMTEMDGYNPFKGKAPGNPEFFPFGKPGGGAPMVDNKGRHNVQRHNVDFAHEHDSSADITKRRRAADEYLNELKREMAEQRRTRNEANVELRAPIGELATIVSQGNVGYPKRDPTTGAILNHHHKTTDITRSQMGIPEAKRFAGVVDGDFHTSFAAKRYHNDLAKVAEERHRMRQLERVRDTQEELKHGQTWNDMWGRPGCGAPNSKDPVFKRPKFNNVLHNPEPRNGLVFIKNTPQGIHQLNPDHYNKSTIGSNHVNMFELPLERPRRERQADYRPTAPFATALPN